MTTQPEKIVFILYHLKIYKSQIGIKLLLKLSNPHFQPI